MSGIESDVDFICLGAGIGGLTAALLAHDRGLSVVVLEKSDQIGGVAAYSSGQTYAPAALFAEQAGVDDRWEAAVEYLLWVSNGTAKREYLEKLCRTASEAFAYTEQAGVKWCPLDLPDNFWPDAPGSLGRGRMVETEAFDGRELPEELRGIVRRSPTNLFSNKEIFFEMGGIPRRAYWNPEVAAQREADDIRLQGSAMAAYFVMAVHERGIPVYTDAIVSEVLTEDGRVTGVVAQIAGEECRFTATKGVLVAMGGYDWNNELSLRFDGRETSGSRSPRSVTGDHFGLLKSLRADIFSVDRGQGLGYPEPPEATGDTKVRWMSFQGGWPHTITVNRAGQRFANEASTGGTASGTRELDENGEPVNLPCWAILDGQHRAKYPLGRIMPGMALPEPFVEAPTVRELAERLGIDPDGLEQTIESFNAMARFGEDPAFERGRRRWPQFQYGDLHWEPNPNLGTLEEPPFVGVRLELVNGAGLTQAGLRTDLEARVVDVDGNVIPGLYAAGNSMGWQDLGGNYHSGTANMRGLVWGYIAARHAAGDEAVGSPAANAAPSMA